MKKLTSEKIHFYKIYQNLAEYIVSQWTSHKPLFFSFLVETLVTARKRSLRRLCFHRCLSVHRAGGVCPIACWDAPSPRPEAHPSGRHSLGRHPCPPPPQRTPRADPPLDRHPPGKTPPAQCMLGYGQQAGGTHPTGMHSCLYQSSWVSMKIYLM